MGKQKQLNPLSADALYRACDPDEFPFQTTAELEDIDQVIGQERAIDALQFGIEINAEGYNMYALGPSGTGKLTTVQQFVKDAATGQAPAADWCYVNNFDEPHKPRAIRLPTGYGVKFREDMEQLIEELSIVIPAAFESDEYRSQLEEIEEELKDQQTGLLDNLRSEAKDEGIMLLKTPTGFAFAPMNKKEEVISSEQFDKLSPDEQKTIKGRTLDLQDKLKKVLAQFPGLRKEAKEKIKALDREIAKSAISHLIDTLRDNYRDLSDVVNYFNIIEKDIIKNVSDFRPSEEESPLPFFNITPPRGDSFHRYKINLLVDNSALESAPVVYENLPTHANLIGRCEYQSQMGTLVTDFTLIKPGALHEANGGYLILEARKLLLQPYAWESLKRILEAGEVRIESLERTLSLISTVSLEPEPIPIDLKVILVGDRLLYYLMNYYDPDFQDLFKVAADFDDMMDRDEGNNLLYARLIASLARHDELLPLEKTAVIRLIEHGARLAGDMDKLTTNIRSINDLLREADHWARQANKNLIAADDVQQAIDKQVYRSDRIKQHINEEIRRGTIMINTTGEVVGQINGLSVIQLGNYSFGRPSRITATMRLGEGEVLDIERETELGGAIHSKGVLILSHFLSARYAPGKPLSMSASIVFEQSYGGIEGDSASLAELCALLSAIAGIPILQSFAMTGSVNQHGQVQPIGGVNEKIEGFFDVCRSIGLSDNQGVLIPTTNVRHLMLRQDVVEAAREGRFNIYPVATVDQALELLTNIPAGERGPDGIFPEQSVNGRVEQQLLEFADIRRRFSRGPRQQDDKNGNE